MHNESLDKACEIVIGCYRNGGKLLVCGNGGSSADSAHIVGELVKGFLRKRPLPEDWRKALGTDALQMGLPAIDLTAQSAVLSAIVNDLGGECVYAQEVMAYGRPGDVLIGISTSGNAENVCLAAKAAKLKGMTTIGMTGAGGGKLQALSDAMLKSCETETYKVQEEHLKLYHQLCARVEAAFFEV